MSSEITESVGTSESEISRRFQALWEQYMKLVNLAIALSSGTFLVFANITFSERVMKKLEVASGSVRLLCLLTAISLGMGIVSAICWHVSSQVWMEIQVFGNKDVANAYLQTIGFADKKAYAFQKGPTSGMHVIWNVSKYSAFGFTVISWCLLVWFGAALLAK